MDGIAYLWGAAALVALFGIWYTLYSRLPNLTQKGEKPLSRKEKAALAEQEKIEAAAQRILEKRGLISSDGDTPEPPPRVTPSASQPVSTAQATREKWAKKGETK